MHEASLHAANSFITLTYSDKYLPKDGGLVTAHYQAFMKRLRKSYGKVRYYHCGEYGEKFNRPHYHSCLFSIDFSSDREHFQTTEQGDKLYTSPKLTALWGMGHASIGELTQESAAYVARYVMKKQLGQIAEDHYMHSIDIHTGECLYRKSEYATMSLKPGIGAGWHEQFATDVYPRDEVIMKGKKSRPPKYYDKLQEAADPEGFKYIRGKRIQQGALHTQNNTPDRLRVREKVTELKLRQLQRKLQ